MTINELIDRALHASYRKQWNKALEYAQIAVNKAPGNYLAHKRLSLSFWHLNQKNKAYEAMKKSIELMPEFASAYYNLACFYAIDNKKTKMLSHLKKAIKLDEYTDYSELAENDDDFQQFFNDKDFLEIIASNKEEINKLQEIFSGNDYEAISEAILQIDKEIPVKAIEWKYSYKETDISSLLKDKLDKISSEALLYLFKMAVFNTSIEKFDAFLELVGMLRSRMKEEFDDVLIEVWKNRYEYTDCGHLTVIDRQILELLEELPTEQCAEVVIWGLKSHGKDALKDYENLCSLLLEKLPESHTTRIELVDIIDNYLHGETYKTESIAERQNRIRITLSPPPVEVPSGTNDRWARQKAGIMHFHPVNVINAASHMAMQSDPEIVGLVKQNLPKICGFITNTSLPVDLRIDAIKSIIEKVGDYKEVASLAPVLLENSVSLLAATGKLMHKFDIEPEEAKTAVSFLIEITKKEDIDNYELHDVVCALSWFKDQRITEVFLLALNNNLEAVRREALRGLSIQKATSAIPQIVAQLKEGSSQCVTAAAKALDAIGGVAHKEFENLDTYKIVLDKAKKSPRWATEALIYFQLNRVNDDLIEIFKTTDEPDAFPYLAKGIADRGKEESIPQLVSLGLDRYESDSISARFFTEIFHGIAIKNGNSPNIQIIKEVKNIVSNSTKEDIIEFTEDLEYDAKYAEISKPSNAEKELVEKYTLAYTTVLKTFGDEAHQLAEVMFKQL